MYHRQAVHFLAKQDYPSALAAVERARMIALSSLDQVYLENYNIYRVPQNYGRTEIAFEGH